MKDKTKKKLIYLTGGIVASVVIALTANSLKGETQAKEVKEYQVLKVLENPEFRINIEEDEDFYGLLERFGYKVTNNVKDLTPNTIYDVYCLVWNAENTNDEKLKKECEKEIQSLIASFKAEIKKLVEKRVPGHIEKTSNNQITTQTDGEEVQIGVSAEAVNKGLALADAVFDATTGVYTYNYTIENVYKMECSDKDLLFLLEVIKADEDFFTTNNILKAISAYIRVLGSEYQFEYNKIKENDINYWRNLQTIEYNGTLVNVTEKINENDEDILEALYDYKEYLLNYYNISNISPNECRVSMLDNKWYLVINSTSEKYSLNKHFSEVCNEIVKLQTLQNTARNKDYTEEVISEDSSSIPVFESSDIKRLYYKIK